MKRLTDAQFACLSAHENGGSHGEAWCQYEGAGGPTAFQWANHERMIDGLTRRGYFTEQGDLSPEGEAVLKAERERREASA